MGLVRIYGSAAVADVIGMNQPCFRGFPKCSCRRGSGSGIRTAPVKNCLCAGTRIR